VGKEAALVIDCGLGPACGQDVAKAAERVAPGRRLTDPAIVVPGHGSLGQAEIARSVREYFADLQARVSKKIEGEATETLISELKPQLLATYPTWEHDRFIDPAIRYFTQAS
jgi:hypothetical protein